MGRDAEEGHMMGVKELGKSKCSDDVDEDGAEASGSLKRNNALSGLIQAYAKKRKSVSWSDQVKAVEQECDAEDEGTELTGQLE